MRFALLALLLVGCASTPELAETVVYVVRHAEAEGEGTRDPALRPEGEARAARLAEALGEVDAVFTSPLLRTRLTAAPAASASGVEAAAVPIGDGGIAAHVAHTVRRVREVEPGSRVLVVGHSNTAPAIAGALAGVDLEDLAHSDHATLFVVTLPASGGPGRLRVQRLE